MRHVDQTPRGVIEGRNLGAGSLRAQEAPLQVEVVLAFQIRIRGARCSKDLKHNQTTNP